MRGSFVPPEVDTLQQILWHFGSHRVLTVAVRTGIMRRLAEGPADTDQVARELELDPVATGKIVRALCALGLVERGRGRVFRLVSGLNPLFVPGMFDVSALIDLSHDLFDMWGENLEPWVRGQRQPLHELSDDQLERFSVAMGAMTNHLAPQILGTLRAGKARRGLDLGGGLGGYAAAFCRMNRDLHMTVVDVEKVVELGRSMLTDPAIKDRITFIAGSYFEVELGADHDMVILSNVLHQELPEAAERLVRLAAECLAPGGRMAIVDFAIDDQRLAHKAGCLSAINMFGFGDVYTEPTIQRWMEAVGLTGIHRADLYPVHWLIIGQRGS